MWHRPYSARLHLAPFKQLEQLIGLTRFADWPAIDELNQLAKSTGVDIPAFVCQQAVGEQDGYYEQIIYQQQRIPTRANNWHDLFNALIWMLFPATKGLLNRLHMQDISSHGLSPRTPRRNAITHFDECGVVLITSRPEILAALSRHDWQQAFVEHRTWWGTEIVPLTFGHANLEMLLNPFVGLTGKWLGLEVAPGLLQQPLPALYREADQRLCERITGEALFEQKGSLKPLPLLGIPEWHSANKDTAFYANSDYFRPLRKRHQ